MQRTRLRAVAALFSSAALLAACGGGGGTNPLPTAAPSATPTATPAAQPSTLPAPAAQSNTASVTASSTAATTTTLPATGGITPSVTIPKTTSGSGTIAVTVATGGDATLGSMRINAARRPQAMPGGGYLLQMDFVPSAGMTFNAAPSFTLDVTKYVTAAGFSVSQAAAFLQTQKVYAGIEDGSGYFSVVGPLSISSTSSVLTVSYAGPAMTLTLHANQHYTIGIHLGEITAPTSSPTTAPTATPTTAPTATPTTAPTATPTTAPTATPTTAPTATPTTAPTATPSPTPTPTPVPMSVSQASLSIAGTGSANAQSFTVSGGTGSYAASGYDTSVISVQPDSSDSARFIVTGLKAGTTAITIGDSAGQTVTVQVSVTTVSGVIQ